MDSYTSCLRQDRFLKTPKWFSKDTYRDPSHVSVTGTIVGPNQNREEIVSFSDTKQAYNHLLSVEFESITRKNQPLSRNINDIIINYESCPLSSESKELLRPYKLNRTINPQANKVLDAPGLIDDFYLNLVDWSLSNILGVGLTNDLYLWSVSDSKAYLLTSLSGGDFWTSISWMNNGYFLAMGTKSGTIEIWDTVKGVLVTKLDNIHSSRIGSLSWNRNVLSSGSKDHFIQHYDIRIPTKKGGILKNSVFSPFCSHRQEVCGLKWDPSGKYLASGGNDNMLCIWDARLLGGSYSGMSNKPLHIWKDHEAAVKAIDWCPSKSNWLASGGGTLDRKLILWDTRIGDSIAQIDTGSQVCNMSWSPSNPLNPTSNDLEMVTSHGYTQNQLILWRVTPLFHSLSNVIKSSSFGMSQLKSENSFKFHNIRSMKKLVPLAHLTGHSQRVIHMAKDPKTSTIVTGSGDETLRFWKVFASVRDNEYESRG